MRTTPITRALAATALALGIALPSFSFAQEAKVDAIVDTGETRAKESAASQKRIDTISDQTGDLLQQYKTAMKVVDGLKVYNALLQRQLDAQAEEMQNLNDSIDKVSVIERGIVPLMIKMVDGLQSFIDLDVPFLLKERQERVTKLRATMERADVTAAEKFRAVLEAYEIENEYGRTIETYTTSLDLDGSPRDVDLLKFGRVALLYQSKDGELNGAWDQRARQWVALDKTAYRSNIRDALRVARKQAAPDLLMLPILPPEAVQ